MPTDVYLSTDVDVTLRLPQYGPDMVDADDFDLFTNRDSRTFLSAESEETRR